MRAARRKLCLASAVLLAAAAPAGAEPSSALGPPPVTIDRVCDLIETHAERNNLPKDFFARLIWKESRFDANAVSPAGAEGIAQFMPGTAALRGLDDSFDIEKAIPASARYLGELRLGFGNLGLAAAAYNAGENRVSRWLSSGGLLPIETEDYVFDIMGDFVYKFSEVGYIGNVQPIDPKASFRDACRRLPVIQSTVTAMATVNVKPWGVQVAGNFRRAAAIKQWQRLKGRFSALLADYEPVVSRVRTPIGRRGIYAVRIGVDNRANADIICQQLRGAGGSCIVVRNR
jgi:hypothetical protein